MSEFVRRAPIRKTVVNRGRSKQLRVNKKYPRPTTVRATVSKMSAKRSTVLNKKHSRMKIDELEGKASEPVTTGSNKKIRLTKTLKKTFRSDELDQKDTERILPLVKRRKRIKKISHSDTAFSGREPSLTQENASTRDPYIQALKDAFQLRENMRFSRMKLLALTTYLPPKSLQYLMTIIESFVQSSGCVDMLDPRLQGDNNAALTEYFSSLHRLIEKLRAMANNEDQCVVYQTLSSDYSLNHFYGDLLVAHSVISDPLLADKIRGRIHRLLGRLTASMFEISSRGVSCSSIWACAAAVVWSKSSHKVPYRPAIVIGVLAPTNRYEEWHDVLTEMNESRLPNKVRMRLVVEKKNAKSSTEMGGVSHFLVEYLGTNEFSWVVEDSIIEGFDPRNDPNPTSRYFILTNPSYQRSIDEALRVMEEFDAQMSDPCGDLCTSLNGNYKDMVI
jgi:hypothetical protein